jgi:ATP-binding cassette, subfamily F, member 3
MDHRRVVSFAVRSSFVRFAEPTPKMILLSAQRLSRQFDTDPIFHDVTFDVRSGERIGLVGPNGTGKTTLMRIIAGLDHADVGDLNRHNSAEIALLEQRAEFSADRTLIDEAKSGLSHLYEMQANAADVADRIADERDPAQQERLSQQYDHLQEELHRLGGYNIDHRVDEVLTGLGFAPDQYDRPLQHFSGGEQSRALLARMLLQNPSLMLLDEPTNHLDIAATEWLESFLSRCDQAMIIVSHDRYFLDRVTQRTLELHGGRLSDYPGNFTAYWKLREERNKVLQRGHEKQSEEIARTENFIRRNKSGQKHAQAADREKKLERMQNDRIELQKSFGEVSMDFGEATRTGDWVIDAAEVSKGFDSPLFSDFTLRIEREDRVGILGPNGSGKTTLLRTLLGELSPDSGTVRHGTGVKIGYFDQQLESVDQNVDAIEAIRPPDAPDVKPAQLRKLLARFGVRGDLALQKVGHMSGGEKCKVALAKVAAQNVNLLVLDEPTNHLDLWARDSLEEALARFEGTLLFVSHDRYFLDRVARVVIVLEPERWRHFEGNYSAFVAFMQNREREIKLSQPTVSESRTAKRSTAGGEKSGRQNTRKFPYRKAEDLEQEIADSEERIVELEASLADPEVHRDGRRMAEITAEYDKAKLKLESLYAHWEEAVELN